MHPLQSASNTDQGKKRANNEDFVVFFEPSDVDVLTSSGCLYIVADGVGGAAYGERASRYASQRVLYEYYENPQIEPGKRLRQAMRQVGDEIHGYALENVISSRMATTMVAVVIRNDTLIVANVGDSRAYVIRNGAIQQVTRDHTIVGEMVRDGAMTEQEAQQSKIKNRITRSLGGETGVHVDIFSDIQLEVGDRVLLCSDGLTRYTTDEDLVEMASEGSAKEVVQDLIDFANRHGGVDNISAILVAIEPVVDTMPTEASVARGYIPEVEPVLATQETKEILDVPEKESLSRLPVIPKRYQPYAIAAAVVLVFICLITTSLRLFGVLGGNRKAAIQATSSAIVAAALSETIAPTITPEIVGAITSNPADVTTPTPAPTETTTLGPTTTPITPSHTLTPEVRSGCNYTIKPGESVDQISIRLGAEYQNYEEIKCANLPNNVGCNFAPNYPNTIQPGWVLTFPNVTLAKCIAAGGTPLATPTPAEYVPPPTPAEPEEFPPYQAPPQP